MARNAAGASLVASAVLGWTWEEDWLLQHRNFGAGINQLVYTVCGPMHRVASLLTYPTLPTTGYNTTPLPLTCLGGDRPRILPTSADAADEVNEQDKVVLARLGRASNVPLAPRTQVLGLSRLSPRHFHPSPFYHPQPHYTHAGCTGASHW